MITKIVYVVKFVSVRVLSNNFILLIMNFVLFNKPKFIKPTLQFVPLYKSFDVLMKLRAIEFVFEVNTLSALIIIY